jgi:predicted DNA-binding transcriptional regulator AlpA
MTTPETALSQRYLRTPDAALILGLSARTLEKHRCYGTGPVFHKLGGRVVYALADLQSWVDQGVRRSTSDPGNGVVHPAKRLDPSVLGAAGPVRR